MYFQLDIYTQSRADLRWATVSAASTKIFIIIITFILLKLVTDVMELFHIYPRIPHLPLNTKQKNHHEFWRPVCVV